jgi:radical SAM superfamily enzyme YgiQ (UPF0313 family)
VESKRKLIFVRDNRAFFPLSQVLLYSCVRSWNHGRFERAYDLHNRLEKTILELGRSIDNSSIIMFSHYVWNSPALLKLSSMVKKSWPHCITIHGGPEIPSANHKLTQWMNKNPSADIAVLGEGECALGEVLSRLEDPDVSLDSLHDVEGLAFRNVSEIVRTADCQNSLSLEEIPSPYCDGTLQLLGEDKHSYFILETNRGCPNSCAYCYWGNSTQKKMRLFPMDRIEKEIDFMGRSGAKSIFCADSNFGLFKRDVDIARMVASAANKYGHLMAFYVNFAAAQSDRMHEIVEILHGAGLICTGIIALQSQDKQTLEAIGRSNISTEKIQGVTDLFSKHSLPLSADLMYPLPGQTYQAFLSDLQYCIDHNIQAKAYRTLILVNTKMDEPEYINQYGLNIYSQKMPRNHFGRPLISTKDASEEDVHKMEQIYVLYTLMIRGGTLRILLDYLRKAMDLKHIEVLSCILRNLSSLPILDRALKMAQNIPNQEQSRPWIGLSSLTDWHRFYEEIETVLRKEYLIENDSAWKTVLCAQSAVMPSFYSSPQSITLQHDLIAYMYSPDSAPLVTFPAVSFDISDPRNLRNDRLLDRIIVNNHFFVGEYKSPLYPNYPSGQPQYL